MTPPVALTVAGTDSGGAAGIAADLTTFAALGVHGACAVTAVTAQHTLGVDAVHPVPVDLVEAQIDAVLGDLPVRAVKTGMLGTPETVSLVASRLGGGAERHLVVDPVLLATSGAVLGDRAVADAYRDDLLPVATVVTPNLAEAVALVGRAAAAPDLALDLAGRGCAVVVTGGPEWSHGDPTGTCTDWVATPDGRLEPHRHPAVPTTHDHGTGCTFSAALAAALAHGADLTSAVAAAAAHTRAALLRSRHWRLGAGRGPIAHVVPGLPVTPTPPARQHLPR